MNDTRDFYRFFDATKPAEFLFDCVRDTIENIVPGEIDYLIRYDAFKQYLEGAYEMPDHLISILVHFLEQNQGLLSKRAKEKEFSMLSPVEAHDIERQYADIFQKVEPLG